MKLMIVSATEVEVAAARQVLSSLNKMQAGWGIQFEVTGVGLLAATFAISKLIYLHKPDVVLQAGIAGCYSNAPLGQVVTVKAEYLADTGVEENGQFNDLFDMNFQQRDAYPFTSGKLLNPHLPALNLLKLPEVTATTINEITTRKSRIFELNKKYKPAIESMEGAALHYCGLQTNTPFIQLRATSNYVGERDKANWRFKDAFTNLAEVLVNYVEAFTALNNQN